MLSVAGYWRTRQITPVDRRDRGGFKGLRAALDPKTRLSDVRYEVKDGTILLLGTIGWGRVNRKRYIQILWIPIPVGDVKL
ncbi:MAG: hypothetical protein ACYTFZ_03850 [Planctomycetota bacterium]